MSDIEKALTLAAAYGQVDGAHHKAWVIDQMVRVLCGSLESYAEFVADFCDGPDGPDTYEWDCGIAP